MVTSADILLGGILPGVIAVATLAGVWKFTKNAASSWRTAVVVSFLVGLWALDSQGVGAIGAVAKSMRITEARDFLPLMVILAIVPDAVAAVGRRGPGIAWVLRVGLCVFVPWRLLAGSRYLPKIAPPPDFDTGAWTLFEAGAWIGFLAAVLLVVWSFVRAASTEVPKLRSSLAVLAALATSTTIALSGSLTYGQLMGVLVATLAGCALLSWYLKLDRGPDAAAGPLVIAFGGVLILAYFFSSLNSLQAALLLVAFAVGAGWFFPQKKWSTPARCAVCLISAAVAVALAGMAFAKTQA